ncbi:MAG: hypothetical protein LBJ04_18205 [Sphingobacterium sp.]|jgi:hypothetical protein|nr:hypothetical protein [Sphingobacterium sp.]
MRTKTRLILQFSLLFAALLTLVLSIIYYLVDKEFVRNFYKRLEDRALTVGHSYLASDNFSKEEYQEVLKKYPRTLPTETIRIYDKNYRSIFIEEDGVTWSKEIIKQIILQKVLYFKHGDNQVTGILYRDNSGDFVIIASASNVYGKESKQELLYAMMMSFTLAICITVLLGNVFAKWILTSC